MAHQLERLAEEHGHGRDKWWVDLDFASHYKKPTRNVRVDRIYAKR